MNSSLRLVLCTATLAVLGACNGNSAAPAADASAAPAKTAADAPAASTEPAAATNAASTSSMTMTMDQVDQFLAGYSALAKAGKTDPAIEALIAGDVSDEAEVQHAARIAGNAKAVALLAQAGTTPTEYARMTQLLPGAIFAYGMMQSGTVKEVPEGVDPALIDFMKAHGDEVGKKVKASGYM